MAAVELAVGARPDGCPLGTLRNAARARPPIGSARSCGPNLSGGRWLNTTVVLYPRRKHCRQMLRPPLKKRPCQGDAPMCDATESIDLNALEVRIPIKLSVHPGR